MELRYTIWYFIEYQNRGNSFLTLLLPVIHENGEILVTAHALMLLTSF